MKRILASLLFALLLGAGQVLAIDHKGISHFDLSPDRFPVIDGCTPAAILADEADNVAVQIALKALQKDFKAVCGHKYKIHLADPQQRKDRPRRTPGQEREIHNDRGKEPG